MLVQLNKLKPNPLRDFHVDPINPTKVKELAQSVRDHGFWGGVVCRSVNGHYEIACGHTRVQAAISIGIQKADVFVGDFDDAGMIRVYARENALQRGNTGTAQAGTIAAAIHYLAKQALTSRSTSRIREHIETDGIGEPVVYAFLSEIKGISRTTVKDQMATLKASGDYARIIEEVRQEIEAEEAENLKALAEAEREQEQIEKERIKADAFAKKAEQDRKDAAARAKRAKVEAEKTRAAAAAKQAELDAKRAKLDQELAAKRKKESDKELKKFEALRHTRDSARKASESAAKRERIFDFEGVAKYMENSYQIETFRKVVTAPAVKAVLPVSEQAVIAKKVKELAGTDEGKMTAEFIRTEVIRMKLAGSAFEAEYRRTLANESRRDLVRALEQKQKDLYSAARGLLSLAMQMEGIMKKLRGKPEAKTIRVLPQFRDAREALKEALALMSKTL